MIERLSEKMRKKDIKPNKSRFARCLWNWVLQDLEEASGNILNGLGRSATDIFRENMLRMFNRQFKANFVFLHVLSKLKVYLNKYTSNCYKRCPWLHLLTYLPYPLYLMYPILLHLRMPQGSS